MVFKSHEKLQAGLDACVTKALADTDSPLVFAHACWGKWARASALRMTRIRTKDDTRIPLLARATANGIDHMEAFQRHIIRFGRSGTLLDWITRWMYQNCRPSPAQLHQKMIAKDLRFLVTHKRGAPLFTIIDNHSIVASKRVFQTLDDRDIVMRYLDELYSRDSPVHPSDRITDALSYPAQQLISLRYDAGRLLANDTASRRHLRSLSELYDQGDARISDEERDWMFLGALQTGFMYVQSAVTADSEAHGFVSVGACYMFQEKDPELCPLGVISAVIPANVTEAHTDEFIDSVRPVLSNELEKTITDIEGCQGLPQRDHLFHVEKDKTGDWDPYKLGKLSDALSPTVQRGDAVVGDQNVQPFPQWQPALLIWLTLVIEGLRGTLHEGNPLTFYFVVADRSLVLDSGLFEMVELQPSAPINLIPWDANGVMMTQEETGNLLDRVRQQVGKKNYAWFLNGKFALLWDATFPRQFPQGLIRFRESSWDAFLSQVHMRKPSRAAGIISAMVFMSTDGSGGVIFHGHQIASFRKGKPWVIGIGDREQRLIACLTKHLTSWGLPQNGVFERTLAFLKEALLVVSDDPHTGCLMVLFKHGTNRESVDRVFDGMGEPWETQHKDVLLQKSLDELTSLMAMDGATCIYADAATLTPKIVFRRLVRISDTPTREICSSDKEKHLDGEGSRKWSAAYAATRPEIAAVISVSQDGPIHIYELDQALACVRILELNDYRT